MDDQDVRILRANVAYENSNYRLAKADSGMFVEQEGEETVADFKRCATVETLTKQQRRQKNIAEYN